MLPNLRLLRSGKIVAIFEDGSSIIYAKTGMGHTPKAKKRPQAPKNETTDGNDPQEFKKLRVRLERLPQLLQGTDSFNAVANAIENAKNENNVNVTGTDILLNDENIIIPTDDGNNIVYAATNTNDVADVDDSVIILDDSIITIDDSIDESDASLIFVGMCQNDFI